MSHPSPGLLDPLADWPRIDPRPDFVRAVIADLEARAGRWDEARGHVLSAFDALAAGRGQAVDVARTHLAELAVAVVGLAEPLREVAGVLRAYLVAHERYEVELAAAQLIAEDSIREVLANRAGSAATTIPLTALRQQAWDRASGALADFADAGLNAAVLVESETSMITGGWVNTGRSCDSVSLFEMLLRGGAAQSEVRGSVDAVRLGLGLLVLRRRGALSAEDVERVGRQITVGGTTLTADDGRLRALAGSLAIRAGVGEGVFAILGIASGVAQAGALLVGDALTALDGGGESGVRGWITRTDAAANGVAAAQLTAEVFEFVGVRALSAVALPVFVATSAYQLGDLAYTYRRQLGSTLGAFAGHRPTKELP